MLERKKEKVCTQVKHAGEAYGLQPWTSAASIDPSLSRSEASFPKALCQDLCLQSTKTMACLAQGARPEALRESLRLRTEETMACLTGGGKWGHENILQKSLLTRRKVMQLRRNRTITTHGQARKNVYWDLCMEHINREAKKGITGLGANIIESVDSLCRDSADTQYMLIQTNFSKSPTYKLLSFIFECFHDEKHTQWR